MFDIITRQKNRQIRMAFVKNISKAKLVRPDNSKSYLSDFKRRTNFGFAINFKLITRSLGFDGWQWR